MKQTLFNDIKKNLPSNFDMVWYEFMKDHFKTMKQYTLEEFEIGLLKRGVSQQTIEEKQQFIRDWYYETDDMNLDELVDDFIYHWNLELSN